MTKAFQSYVFSELFNFSKTMTMTNDFYTPECESKHQEFFYDFVFKGSSNTIMEPNHE